MEQIKIGNEIHYVRDLRDFVELVDQVMGPDASRFLESEMELFYDISFKDKVRDIVFKISSISWSLEEVSKDLGNLDDEASSLQF